MASKSLIAAITALALSSAVASAARAQEARASGPVVVTLNDRNLWGPQQMHKSFQWDAGKSRWGLKFDVDQSPVRNGAWQDVQAGAYYKLNPSLSIGGGVSVHDQALTTANPNQNNPQTPPGVPATVPRVHLETAFKF